MAKKIGLAGILGGIALFVWESVAQELKANIREPGFYFFPAPDHTPGMRPEQHREADRKTQERWNVRQMCTQFGTNVLAMLLSAILLSWATGLGGYGGRALFVTLIGLIPTLVQFTVHLVGFAAGGLAVASLVKPGAGRG
jgi:hypothetical protein